MNDQDQAGTYYVLNKKERERDGDSQRVRLCVSESVLFGGFIDGDSQDECLNYMHDDRERFWTKKDNKKTSQVSSSGIQIPLLFYAESSFIFSPFLLF